MRGAQWGGGYHEVIGSRVLEDDPNIHHTASTVAPRARWPDSIVRAFRRAQGRGKVFCNVYDDDVPTFRHLSR